MKADLEQDILNSEFIKNKCKYGPTYRQNLYASLCNNRFYYGDQEWTCSWRYAGRIVSEINDGDSYMDFYCSGNEGEVTEEIRMDLLRLGWTIKPYENIKVLSGEYGYKKMPDGSVLPYPIDTQLPQK